MGLSNAQYDQVMRIFQDRRMNAELAQRENRSVAYASIPELHKLDMKLIESGIEAIAGDANVSMEELTNQIHKKKKILLAKNGYPEDFLDVTYQCKDCKDTGYVGDEHCHCFYNTATEIIYSNTRIKDSIKAENFDSFDLNFYSDKPIAGEKTSPRQKAKEAISRARLFVDSFGNEEQNIIITGNTGTGKTFLSNCIAGEILSKGYFVVFLSAFSLFSIMKKQTYKSYSEYEDADYESIFKCDLLILDDLGTEYVTDFTSSRLFQCINERLLHKRSTVINTNLNMKQLNSAYSERLVSRLVGSYIWIELSGEDIRLKKKLA